MTPPRLCALALLLLPTLAAQDPPPKWTPELQMEVRSIGAVNPSPDGLWVAYTVSWPVMDPKTSEVRTQIYLAAADGSREFQLTAGEHSATAPEFSLDSRQVYFRSKRSEKQNIWRISIDGGEAQQVTDWDGQIGNFALSPDGRWLAFAGRKTDPDKKKAEEEKRDFKVIDDKPENHGLWLLPVDGADKKAGLREVVKSDRHLSSFNWAPDSKTIAYSSVPTPLADDWTRADLFEVTIDSGESKPLSQTEAAEESPRYSPDGRSIAFVFNPAPVRWAGDCHLAVIARDSGEITHLPLTQPDECGRGTALLGWTPDSKALYFTQVNRTRAQLKTLALDGKQTDIFAPKEGTISGYGGAAALSSKGNQIGFAFEKTDAPPEAFLWRAGVSAPTQVSQINSRKSLPPTGRTDVIRWKSKDGLEVEGLLTYPVGYESGQKYPLILNIHGGPMGVFTETYLGSRGIYPVAAFASEGFAILRPNPRGSSGYGKKFRFANYNDWGGGDYEDVMSGVDRVIEMGVADPKRMIVMGWSYGGFMTSWVIGQTDRFQAAAVGAAVTNLWSFTGTADIPGFLPDYFSGEPWENFELYRKHSPMSYVDKVKTPSLILHGEQDLRVPVSQGYEFYNALKRRHVPVEMVVYPRTPHGPEEPKFILDVARRHLEWSKKYAGVKSGPATEE